ncbi:DUF4422 domain-containing protein [Segatella baroniae]|uniref:DUF4422 domain-containing protein n=1 Tax=Segatella baroniae TaxID=305719 RepID=UPI0003FCFF6B|nr:DUF4422 domain-containing protein [Segatella baroniae]
MKAKILVAYHKSSTLIKDNIFTPIQVGKECSKIDLGFQGDNTGDNISAKNSTYCELTAIYWAWKNLKADYVGLCHYRRLLSFSQIDTKRRIYTFLRYQLSKYSNLIRPGANLVVSNMLKLDENEYIKDSQKTSKKISKALERQNIDAIVPKPFKLSCMNAFQYFEYGLSLRLLLDKTIKDVDPEFYVYFVKAGKSNKIYAANMFVFKKEIFNEYCTILFKILNEFEYNATKTGWCNNIQTEGCFSRMAGFVAELLTSAFIMKLREENYKILYSNIAFLK